MAYQVLARKWRPMTFTDMIGQDHISETLLNAIQHNRVGHAYLFVGTRGTGKTTSARIFAKALNCLTPEANGNPCDKCESCTEITNGSSLDVMEIDGASNNKVEDIRDLRDNVQYAPARSKYKIYIIDEAHMLTPQAWNALLKTLEEPPSHVKFFFATTEVHKFLPTIISRCQRFDLKRIPQSAIAQRLREITVQEQIPFADCALNAIARAANGGMRDALSITDQMIAFCSNTGREITEEDVTEVFGLTSSKDILDIIKAIIQNNAASLITQLNKQADKGKNLEQLYSDLLTYARNIMVILFSGQEASKILQLDPLEFQQLHETARLSSPSVIQRIVDGFLSQDGKIRHTLNKRIFLEISLIKIMREGNSIQLEDILKRMNHLRKGGELSDFNEQVALSVKNQTELPPIEEYSFPKKEEASPITPAPQKVETVAVSPAQPTVAETPVVATPVEAAPETVEIKITPTLSEAEPAELPVEKTIEEPIAETADLDDTVHMSEEPITEAADLDDTVHLSEEPIAETADLDDTVHLSENLPEALDATQASMTQTLQSLENQAQSSRPANFTDTVALRRSLPNLDTGLNTSAIINELSNADLANEETQQGDTSTNLAEKPAKPYANLKKVETIVPEYRENLETPEPVKAPVAENENASFVDSLPAPVNLKSEEEVAKIKNDLAELDQTLIDDSTPTIHREINDEIDYPINTLINPEQVAAQIQEDPLQLGFTKRQKKFNPEKESTADLFYKIETATEANGLETLNSTINPEEAPLLQTDHQVPEQDLETTIAPQVDSLLQTDHQVPEQDLETTIAPQVDSLLQTDHQVPEESLETTIAPNSHEMPQNNFIQEETTDYNQQNLQTISLSPETLRQDLNHQTQTINTVPVPTELADIWHAMHSQLAHSSISSIINEIQPITWQNDNLCLGLDFKLFKIDANAKEAISHELQRVLCQVVQSRVCEVRLMPVTAEKVQAPQLSANQEIWNRVHQDEFMTSVTKSFEGNIIDARGHDS